MPAPAKYPPIPPEYVRLLAERVARALAAMPPAVREAIRPHAVRIATAGFWAAMRGEADDGAFDAAFTGG